MAQHPQIIEMRMDAMKKVYAEMILNTSKEAAARILLAERKALCFQKELFSLKDESIRLLLCLKHNLHSQIQEAEARSLNQQMKIDELEAQLSEAEEIIVDLRDELKQAQEKLEIARHNPKEHLNEHISTSNEPILRQMNRSQISDAEYVLLDGEAKAASLRPEALCNKCITPVKSHLDQFHSVADDISLMNLQIRETNQCRNGFTLKTCAFQRNLSNERLHSPEPKNHQSVVNDQSESDREEAGNNRQYPATEKKCVLSDGDKSSEEPCSASPSETDERNVKKKKTHFRGRLHHSNGCNEDVTSRSLRRSAGRNARYREAIASLQSKPRKKYVRSCEEPFTGQLKACSSNVGVGISGKVVEKKPKKITFRCASLSDDFSPKMNSDDAEVENMSCSDEEDGAENEEILRNKFLPSSIRGPVGSESELSDAPILKGSRSFQNQVVKGSPMKLLSHRKRRKKALSKLDENIIPNKKRRVKATNGSVSGSHGSKYLVRGDSQ